MAAPAVLRQLQRDAAKFSAEVEGLEDRLAALKALPPNAADTEENKVLLNRVDMELAQARKNFSDTAKILLNFEVKVDDSKRDVSEKISRDDASKFAKMFVIHTREATVKLAGQFADKILAEIPREVFDVCETKTKAAVHDFTWRGFHEAHASGILSAVREAHLPSFFEDAIKSVI